MFAFLTLNFWIGIVLGASFPLFWAKAWTWLKAKIATKYPTIATDINKVATDLHPVATVVDTVAEPVINDIENQLTLK